MLSLFRGLSGFALREPLRYLSVAALVACAGLVVSPAGAQLASPVADWSASSTVISAPSTAAKVSTTGMGSAQVQVTGTFTGLSFTLQGSIDGANWFNVPAIVTGTQAAVTAGTALTATGNWFVNSSGLLSVRANVSALTTGSALVTMRAGAGSPASIGTSGGGGIAGTVTANAGTNLNTSTLALETGGNLASIVTKLGSQAATGSAVPANAGYVGSNVAGNLAGLIGCGSSIVYDASTSGSTQLVGLLSGKIIYVCGYTIFSAGTVNVELDYGTGAACVTGTVKMTPAYQLTAQTGAVDGSSFYRGLASAASNALCLKTSAGIAVQAVVYYTQY